MKLIEGITQDYKQKLFLTIDNYGYAELTLKFNPNQVSWFFDLVWQDFSTYNQKLTLAPNVLRQYKDVLPFGLFCLNDNNVDPCTIDAFTNDTALFLLEEADVEDFETRVYGA